MDFRPRSTTGTRYALRRATMPAGRENDLVTCRHDAVSLLGVLHAHSALGRRAVSVGYPAPARTIVGFAIPV